MRKRTSSLDAKAEALARRAPELEEAAFEQRALADAYRLMRGGDLPRDADRRAASIRALHQTLCGASVLPPTLADVTGTADLQAAFLRGRPLFDHDLGLAPAREGDICEPDEAPDAWAGVVAILVSLLERFPPPPQPTWGELEADGVDLGLA